MLLKFKNKTIFIYIIIIKNGYNSRLRAMHFMIDYLLKRYWYLYPIKILYCIYIIMTRIMRY